MPLYLLVLAVVPCCIACREFEPSTAQKVVVSNRNDSDCDPLHSEHPPCSPVSPCHCCFGFEVAALQLDMFVTPSTLPTKAFASLEFTSRFANRDVWQPPKF